MYNLYQGNTGKVQRIDDSRRTQPQQGAVKAGKTAARGVRTTPNARRRDPTAAERARQCPAKTGKTPSAARMAAG